MNMEEAADLCRLLRAGETEELRAAEERLCAKCRHEQMSRTAVLIEWGDPRNWPGARGVKGTSNDQPKDPTP